MREGAVREIGDRILRFTRSERLIHWSIAIPFLVCYLTAVILVLALSGSAAAVTSNYQEWRWNPSLNGMGWNVGQQDGTVFMAWYHYDTARRPTFLYMAGTLNNNLVTGTLFRSNGPPPQNYNPSSFGNVAVGNASLRFTGPNSATFSYSFDAQSGIITLERFTFDPMDLSGFQVSAGRDDTRQAVEGQLRKVGDDGEIFVFVEGGPHLC